jgi:hypothetical protein
MLSVDGARERKPSQSTFVYKSTKVTGPGGQGHVQDCETDTVETKNNERLARGGWHAARSSRAPEASC